MENRQLLMIEDEEEICQQVAITSRRTMGLR